MLHVSLCTPTVHVSLSLLISTAFTDQGLWLQIVEKVCKEAQKQARIYQESIRDMAELDDTTGVELFQGRDSGKARSMMAIKAEKIQRAK